jgi:uncharacterized membrane protein
MNTFFTRKHENHASDHENLACIIYILQVLGFFLGGITFIIGVVLNYIYIKDVKGTWLESHYRWQIEMFWVALLLVLIGTITLPFFIGFAVLFGATIWVIYRIVYGWVTLNKSKEVTTISRFPFI